jgi:acetyl-CoA carboxylase biotin carboxyl carrier protein
MLKNKIESLIKLIKDTEIQEIEITSFWGAQKIRLSKSAKVSNQAFIKENQVKEVIIEDTEENKQEIVHKNIEQNNFDNLTNKSDNIISDKFIYIKAPLVGTYYSSPKPSDPPFIKIGDKITKGQTVCIIEAMKIFNDIESEYSGTVTELLVGNGDPVEFDSVMIKILPD